MMPRLPDGFVLFVALVALILALPTLASATPFLWVDTVNGSDTSADPYMPNQPLRTYARAIALGADGDTIGVKIVPGSAAPSPDEAYIIISHKPDIVRGKTQRNVIAGHLDVDSEYTAASTEAGIKIITTLQWEIVRNANGLQEVCSGWSVSTVDY